MDQFSRKKLILVLLAISLADMAIPIPFLSFFALYIVVKRPIQFLERIRQLYAAS